MNKKQKEYFGYYSWCDRTWLWLCNFMANMGYEKPLIPIIFKEIEQFFSLVCAEKPWHIIKGNEIIELVSEQGNTRIKIEKNMFGWITIIFDSQKREKQFKERLRAIFKKYSMSFFSYV